MIGESLTLPREPDDEVIYIFPYEIFLNLMKDVSSNKSQIDERRGI